MSPAFTFLSHFTQNLYQFLKSLEFKLIFFFFLLLIHFDDVLFPYVSGDFGCELLFIRFYSVENVGV